MKARGERQEDYNSVCDERHIKKGTRILNPDHPLSLKSQWQQAVQNSESLKVEPC